MGYLEIHGPEDSALDSIDAVEKLLLIVNSAATSVSPRTKEVIAKALAADFKLEVIDTTSRNHASELAADAVDRDFDAVIAFGGDGTVNEVAQGLVGTDVALGVLPGGHANVVARTTGVPVDPVEATAFVASRLRTRSGRRINVGRINERFFLFCGGVGFDAEVVRQIEAARAQRRASGDWAYVSKAVKTALTRYRGADPSITIEITGREPQRVVLAVFANARPFTYFRRLPVDACPQARLDGGLDVLGLTKVRTLTIPRIAWSVLVSRHHPRWRITRYYHDLTEARLVADAPVPVQVDGDYIGEHVELELRLVPSALALLV